MEQEPRPRVSRVAAKNFKSLRDASFAPRDFSCLIGPNNSGKTNLLDIFAFIHDLTRMQLPTAFGESGGPKAIRYFGADESAPIELNLEWEHLPHPGSKTQYKIVIDADGSVQSEVLKDMTSNTPLWSVRSEGPSTLVSYRLHGNLDSISYGGRMSQSQLSGPMNAVISELNRPFLSHIRRWRTYRFSPDLLKAVGPAQEAESLARNGANFASYLHTVQSKHRKAFGRIEDQLRLTFPEIDELLSPLVGSSTVVGIREKWFKRDASGRQLSDGLVGFLAHLAVLFGPDEPSLVIFEEPENYIHARLMERLVEMMKAASDHTQVVITTHSVSLLNRLHLEDIFLIDRTAGGTSISIASGNEELRRRLADWALGDAYVSGAIGGVSS